MEIDFVEAGSSNNIKSVENNTKGANNEEGNDINRRESERSDLVNGASVKDLTQNIIIPNSENPGSLHGSYVSADSTCHSPSENIKKTHEKDQENISNNLNINDFESITDNMNVENIKSTLTVNTVNTELKEIGHTSIKNNSKNTLSKDTDETYVKDNDEMELGSSNCGQRNNSKVKLYAEDVGPKLYAVKGNIVTPPIITKNLPDAFKFMPVFGMPKNTAQLGEFQNMKTREYVGDLSDEEYSKLAQFCSPDNLRTGHELVMTNRVPTQEPLPDHILNALEASGVGDNLCVVKKLKLRVDKDTRQVYMKKLKYRGLKLLPLPQNEDYKISFSPLEPGKDLIFRIRVYRPFYCNGKERHNTRHSVFSNDMVLLGRQKLTALRDRLVCPNDVGTRVDVSESPDEQPTTSVKEIFPSGFLFINNVFYVDTREGCLDFTGQIREWARGRNIGDFPRKDMSDVTIDQLLIKLGHPEVYVHQGNCQHLFTFSEVRLLSPADPLRQSVYPFHTAISQHQTIYCTTCAEFGARWIVTGCCKVPFDPAFFCETCFKLYLYKDGKKVCEFKAYSFRGNEINLLKPLG